MADTLKDKILSGVFWQGVERIGSQGISFVISIILARLLAPEDFGMIAIMLIFVTLCNVFVDSGFSTALIQKKDAEAIDFCCVFYINITMAVCLYAVLWLSSVLIAKLFNEPRLVLYLRCLSLSLLIRSFSLIQQTLLVKRMLFRLSFRINWIALLLSGIAGITIAYCGGGIWALIVQQLLNAVIASILLFCLVKWRPQLLFSWQRVSVLFRFGGKMFCSSLLDVIYNDLYTVVIGKITNLKVLSFYNRGKTLPALACGIINGILGSVLFPAFSIIQDDKDKIRELTKRGLHNVMFCVIPILTFLFIAATPLIKVLLTDKWLSSVVFLRISCFIFFFYPFHTINLQIISALGRGDIYLVVEVIKKIQGILFIFCVFRYGVLALAVSEAILGCIAAMENGVANWKLIGYPPWLQVWHILPLAVIASISGACSHFLFHSVQNSFVQLLAIFLSFCFLYLLFAFVTKQIPRELLSFFHLAQREK